MGGVRFPRCYPGLDNDMPLQGGQGTLIEHSLCVIPEVVLFRPVGATLYIAQGSALGVGCDMVICTP